MKNYLTESARVKTAQFRVFKEILAKHGIFRDKQVCEILGMKQQTYSARIRGGQLNLSLIELQKLIIKLNLSAKEVYMLVKGVSEWQEHQ